MIQIPDGQNKKYAGNDCIPRNDLSPPLLPLTLLIFREKLPCPAKYYSMELKVKLTAHI